MTALPLCLSLLGDTASSLPWGAALPAILPCATTRSLPLSETDGVLIVGSLDGESLGLAARALLARAPVLCLAPAQLDHSQISELCEAAAQGEGLLRFAQPFEHNANVDFLERLFAGGEPLLRPRYLRVLRLAKPGSSGSLVNLLNEELAWATSLFGAAQRVLALPGNRDLARTSAIFVTLEYEGAMTIQCTVSQAEGIDSRHVVIATGERSLLLDEPHPANGLPSRQGTQQESGTPGNDELVRFCQAIRSSDASLGNSLVWRDVATLWAAARESARSGMPVTIEGRVPAEAKAGPPPLRLIEGGGRRSGRGPRPRLTLVAG